MTETLDEKFDKKFKPQQVLVKDFGNEIDNRDEKIKQFYNKEIYEIIIKILLTISSKDGSWGCSECGGHVCPDCSKKLIDIFLEHNIKI